MQWLLEIALMGLLVATLVHAVRLRQALAVLKGDRAPLEQLVASFAAGTREAQAGIDHLRQAADGAGRRITQQIEVANALRDDLAYMTERAERLADRLDVLVRDNRAFETRSSDAPARLVSPPTLAFAPPPSSAETADYAAAPVKIRSQAERDLLQALRSNK
jgi:hypothetical protein